MKNAIFDTFHSPQLSWSTSLSATNFKTNLSERVIRRGVVGGVSVRSDVMPNRLGDAIEEQSHAHAAGEEHEEPSDVVVLGNVIVLA